MRKANYIKRVCHYPALWLLIGLLSGCGQEARLEPTVLCISLDGFRWDYRDKAATPNLDRLAATGVQARALLPVFPTKTFPNHYTIATGLYPENHGIISNTIFDPVSNDTFELHDRAAVSDGHWYGGEPIWVTAEKQGKISATLFWAGSEAEIGGVRPSYWLPYDHDMPIGERVDQVLAWLDLPPESRPTLLSMYFPHTDDGGHRGTNSPELIAAIQEVDSALGLLFRGLIVREIMEEINIIVLSDHGMTDTDPSRVIFIDDYIDPDQAGVIDWSPVLALRPHEELQPSIYAALENAHPRLQVYLREDMPARLHYATHHRIPPIIGIADEGWSISTHGYYERDPAYFNGGTHGYDNRHPSMHGIFIARGPAFENGLEVSPFQNIHVYHLIARILDLEPASNDGSLDSVKVLLN